jgi:hypothetical protein
MRQQAGHMTALRNDQHQSKKTLHKRSHPHMTAPSDEFAEQSEKIASIR